jgi:hypothetical protein
VEVAYGIRRAWLFPSPLAGSEGIKGGAKKVILHDLEFCLGIIPLGHCYGLGSGRIRTSFSRAPPLPFGNAAGRAEDDKLSATISLTTMLVLLLLLFCSACLNRNRFNGLADKYNATYNFT